VDPTLFFSDFKDAKKLFKDTLWPFTYLDHVAELELAEAVHTRRHVGTQLQVLHTMVNIVDCLSSV
jgi:hypothetical protein